MNSARSFPVWVWWAIGIVAIAAVAAGVAYFVSNHKPTLPPGLVELREAVAKIIEESSKLEDVDVTPLAGLEAKKDYTAAVNLMEKALQANASAEAFTASLVTVSQNLAALSVEIKSEAIATKAIDAFGILAKLANAEAEFYADRRKLYEITRDYYADLAAKKNAPIPEGLEALAGEVSADLEKVRGLHQEFASALAIFDEAVAGAK